MGVGGRCIKEGGAGHAKMLRKGCVLPISGTRRELAHLDCDQKRAEKYEMKSDSKLESACREHLLILRILV